MDERFVVVFEDNGADLFEGTYEECEAYIEEFQVQENDRRRDEFGIYPFPTKQGGK